MAVRLESSMVSQHLDSLALTQEALDEEIAKYNKLLSSNQAKISSFVTLIGQKQTTISNYNKKIYQIVASTGVRNSGSWWSVVYLDGHSVAKITDIMQ